MTSVATLRRPGTWDPHERDAVLLAMREAEGGWVEVAVYWSDRGAAIGLSCWQRHCRRTRWEAFEFRLSHDRLGVLGRFVGTRITRCKLKVSKRWTTTRGER